MDTQIKDLFPAPFRYEPKGTFILSKDGHIALDVRGWGKLHSLLGLELGAVIQDDYAQEVVKALNSHWDGSNEALREKLARLEVSLENLLDGLRDPEKRGQDRWAINMVERTLERLKEG